MAKKAAKKVADRHVKNQGMNWITKHKRLAIYMRDGLCCVYCGTSIEDGAKLTLDHLLPHSHGGSNHESNLVTCCHKCNSSRGNRNHLEFAEAVASYLNNGITKQTIIDHIGVNINKPLDVKAAKAMIASRGWANALRK